MNTETKKLGFFRRLRVAFACFFRSLGRSGFAQDARRLLDSAEGQKPAERPPERVHASGLGVLAILQREGRLIDFLQEDIAAYSDEQIGAATRMVHAGCRKVLTEYLTLEPVLKDAEGTAITVPEGFDAQRIRLTGQVAGQPPFHGALKHHGWVATTVSFPSLSEHLDPRVIAPAEVELS